jgi:purine-binding chemotaxis protein CheW
MRSYCSFWLGGQCLALPTEVVGEFVVVETFVPVPRTPAAVVGLFSLRGEPVALLDLMRALELPSRPLPVSATPSALVLRTDVVQGAILVDRMHAVAGVDLGEVVAAMPEEPAAVAGFCSSPRDGQPMTILRSEIILERIQALRQALNAAR